MERVTITQDDTYPYLNVVVYQGDPKRKEVFPLTGYTGKLYLYDINGKEIISGSDVTISNESEGKIRYSWSAEDTAISGRFYGVIKLTSGTLETTVPNNGYFIVDIIPNSAIRKKELSGTLYISTISVDGETS